VRRAQQPRARPLRGAPFGAAGRAGAVAGAAVQHPADFGHRPGQPALVRLAERAQQGGNLFGLPRVERRERGPACLGQPVTDVGTPAAQTCPSQATRMRRAMVLR